MIQIKIDLGTFVTSQQEMEVGLFIAQLTQPTMDLSKWAFTPE